MSLFRPLPTAVAAVTCLVAGAVAAQCCSVPVFRYALDHWPLDPFRLEVAQSDFRSDSLANTLRNLGENSPFNLEAERSNDPAAPSRLFAPIRGRSQGQTESPPPLWEGALTSDAFKALTDSPARREIARLILEGHSMVWILVETGQNTEDEPARKLFEQRLRFLEQVSELPPIDPSDPSNKIGPGPQLALKLALLRVSRNNPAETHFLKMLAGPNGLDSLPPEKPFAAVVFGRGRVLGAWSDPDESTIEEASRFLMGACSCQVKNQNPGWDLLSPTAWDESLRIADQKRVAALEASSQKSPEAGSTAQKATPQPETVVFQSTSNPPDKSPESSRSLITSSVFRTTLAMLLVAFSLVLAVAARRPKRP